MPTGGAAVIGLPFGIQPTSLDFLLCPEKSEKMARSALDKRLGRFAGGSTLLHMQLGHMRAGGELKAQATPRVLGSAA